MSLRQSVLRPTSSIARTRLVAQRALSTSTPRRGGHDDHAHSSSGPDDTETHEGWFSKPWRNTYIVTILGMAAWPFLPPIANSPASPHTSPSEFAAIQSDSSVPWITRKLAGWMETRESLESRRDAHIDAVMQSADSKILIQDAQRPEIVRTKNRYLLDTGSPYGVAVGANGPSTR